jgi:acetylglutamate kinase
MTSQSEQEVPEKRLVILKIGGQVVDSPAILEQFSAGAMRLLNQSDAPIQAMIIVHGGGAVATQISKRLGVDSRMVQGRRITSAEMRDVCVMVYRGLVNTAVVTALQRHAASTYTVVGVCGADAQCLRSVRRLPVEMGETVIDFGFVGDIESVRVSFFHDLLMQRSIPVIAPLTVTQDGTILNTNADTIAQEIAVAMAGMPGNGYHVELWYCFEKKGVLRDVHDDTSVIPQITAGEYEEYKRQGIITGGMIPKIDNAFQAIARGVHSVRICHAEDIASMQDTSFGTVIIE